MFKKNKPTKLATEYYAIKGGLATRLDGDEERLLTVHGRTPPDGVHVLTLPDKKGVRRIALYPEKSVNPIPVGAPIITPPKHFSVEDFKNLLGPYLPHLLRRALKLQEDGKWTVKDWVFMGLITLNTLGVGACIALVVKGFKAAGLF